MPTITTPITGGEDFTGANGPAEALIAFYRAFNARDLEGVAANWVRTDEASMSNPLGGLCRGWDTIGGLYAKLFSGPAEVYVEFHDYTLHRSGPMFCAVGRERGGFRRGGTEIELTIRTSRTYRLEHNRWRQLHHHGSIEDPRLLAAYQEAVLG